MEADPASGDPLSRPRVFRALAELLKVHPKPMNATQFMEATRYWQRNANKLLDDLQAWRYVTVRQGRVFGTFPSVEIHLTPLGVEMAKLALAADELQEKAKAEAPED